MRPLSYEQHEHRLPCSMRPLIAAWCPISVNRPRRGFLTWDEESSMTHGPGSAVPFVWFEGWLASLKIAQMVVRVHDDHAGVHPRLGAHESCRLHRSQRSGTYGHVSSNLQ